MDNGQQAGVNECKNGGEHSVFRLLLVGIEKHLELLRRQKNSGTMLFNCAPAAVYRRDFNLF